MQNQKRIFDDLAKVAGGALGALGNLKQEIEMFVRQRVDDFLLQCDFVKRDEFEVVKSMVSELRKERDNVLSRLEALEVTINIQDQHLQALKVHLKHEPKKPSKGKVTKNDKPKASRLAP
jgi:BMFP domain-containing protein YqiC